MTILDAAQMLVMRSAFEAQMTPAAFQLAQKFTDDVNSKGSGINHRRMIDLGEETPESQMRAKLCEIFWCALHDTPIDLNIHEGDDGGYDTVYRGWSIEIKRIGTRTAKRGKPWFKREINDLYIRNPPWDFGVVIEDDARDPTVFRTVGYVDRERWLHQMQRWDKGHACWYVEHLDPPSRLTAIEEREPARPWPPAPLVPPELTDLERVVLDVLATGKTQWRRVIALLGASANPRPVQDAFGMLVARGRIRPIPPDRYEIL